MTCTRIVSRCASSRRWMKCDPTWSRMAAMWSFWVCKPGSPTCDWSAVVMAVRPPRSPSSWRSKRLSINSPRTSWRLKPTEPSNFHPDSRKDSCLSRHLGRRQGSAMMSDPNLPGELSALKRFARRGQQAAEAALESCEFCSEPIPSEHRHLLEVSKREVRCVCQACSILFDREAASLGKFRLIPDRRLYFPDFRMDDIQWESLRIPVGLAFLFYSTPAQKVLAYY